MINLLTNINFWLGMIVLILNIIPLFTKTKYYGITLPVSILLTVIRILFIN
jgi:hypothetical protein